MYIVGIILVVIAGILVFARRSQQGKLTEVKFRQTTSAAELDDLAKAVQSGTGATGAFRRDVELKGSVQCDTPLTSEVAKLPCAYYSMYVTREYDEVYTETNPDTKQPERKTRRKSDTVASNTRSTDFWVADASGRILVKPQGANVEGEQVVDRFEPWMPAVGSKLSVGNFSFDLAAFLNASNTVGYHFHESILPLNRAVFVLGEASDSSGQLAVQKPKEKGPFLISLKSEEEIVKAASGSVRWLMYGAIALAVAGVALIVVGLIR